MWLMVTKVGGQAIALNFARATYMVEDGSADNPRGTFIVFDDANYRVKENLKIILREIKQ